VVFVSGFGQTKKYPEYLITTVDGTNPIRFSTQSLLNKRDLIAWMPDSSGILVVEDETNLMLVPRTNTDAKQAFFTAENNATIDKMERVENLLYYFTNDNRWHVIDLTTKRQVARIPTEIAQEIHRPNFIPWYNKSFLIEETVRPDPSQFNRLWLSNFMGIKKLVIDKYFETTVQNLTPEL
jgi:hypothetical protein